MDRVSGSRSRRPHNVFPADEDLVVSIFLDLCNDDLKPVASVEEEGYLIEPKIDVISHLDMCNALWEYHVTYSVILSTNERIFDDRSDT